jgi:hypothetical protein
VNRFFRLFRSARNRRRHSRIPGLFESMKRFNQIGDGKIPWEKSPTITRPIFDRWDPVRWGRVGAGHYGTSK